MCNFIYLYIYIYVCMYTQVSLADNDILQCILPQLTWLVDLFCGATLTRSTEKKK